MGSLRIKAGPMPVLSEYFFVLLFVDFYVITDKILSQKDKIFTHKDSFLI